MIQRVKRGLLFPEDTSGAVKIFCDTQPFTIQIYIHGLPYWADLAAL